MTYKHLNYGDKANLDFRTHYEPGGQKEKSSKLLANIIPENNHSYLKQLLDWIINHEDDQHITMGFKG